MVIAAIDPASKVARTFTSQDELAQAIQSQGWIPIHTDGSPFDVKFLEAEGGFVIDGAPLNVYFEGVWYQGQKEVLQPYIDAGQVPMPDQSTWNLPTVPMPEAILSQYVEFKRVTGQPTSAAVTGEAGFGNMALIGGGLLLAALFLFSGKKSPASGAEGFSDF